MLSEVQYHKKKERSLLFLSLWRSLIAWTLLVSVSLAWNLLQVRQKVLEMAHITAVSNYEKDILYRRWNASHGGVYVPPSPESPPNPWLAHLPERDVTTTSGKKLTLINPAYMTRQVYDRSKKESQIRGNIVSLNPMDPLRIPDAWETRALQACEKGTKEVSSVEVLDQKPYLRLLRPFYVEKGCLNCHAQQGYKIGDIRGGISIAVPMEAFWASGRQMSRRLCWGFGFLWLIGGVTLSLGAHRVRSSDRNRRQAGTTVTGK